MVESEGYVAADQYLQELMVMWWKLWKQRALTSLLPYYRSEKAKIHRNLREGDICLLLYESKILANYRLCRVQKAEPSEDGCVWTVTIGYLPRKAQIRVAYHPVPLEQKEVAIQQLVLIMPVEEQTGEKQVASDAQGGVNQVQSLSFCGIQGQERGPPPNKETQSLSFHGIQGQGPPPNKQTQSLSFRGRQGQAGGASPGNQVQSLSCHGIQVLVKGPSRA